MSWRGGRWRQWSHKDRSLGGMPPHSPHIKPYICCEQAIQNEMCGIKSSFCAMELEDIWRYSMAILDICAGCGLDFKLTVLLQIAKATWQDLLQKHRCFTVQPAHSNRPWHEPATALEAAKHAEQCYSPTNISGRMVWVELYHQCLLNWFIMCCRPVLRVKKCFGATLSSRSTASKTYDSTSGGFVHKQGGTCHWVCLAVTFVLQGCYSHDTVVQARYATLNNKVYSWITFKLSSNYKGFALWLLTIV